MATPHPAPTHQGNTQNRSISEFFNWSAFIAIGAIFGGCIFVAKIVTTELCPIECSLLRVALAIVVIRAMLGRRKLHHRIPAKRLPKVYFAGLLFQGITYPLFFWGMQYLSVGLGGILEGSIPLFIFVIALASRTGNESLSKVTVSGLALGFFGLLLIFGSSLSFSGSSKEAIAIVVLVLMVAGMSWGAVINRTLMSGDEALDLTEVIYKQTSVSLVFLLVLWMLLGDPSRLFDDGISLTAVMAIVYLGIFPTAINNLLFGRLTRDWGAIKAGCSCYLTPAFALLFEFVFLSELPSGMEMIGGFVVLVGVLLTDAERLGWTNLLQPAHLPPTATRLDLKQGRAA